MKVKLEMTEEFLPDCGVEHEYCGAIEVERLLVSVTPARLLQGVEAVGAGRLVGSHSVKVQ